MHWGVYSAPAHGSEWYERYMYDAKNTAFVRWQTDYWGPPEKFGYKDFFPMFTAAKWDPDAWAQLFKDAGAKYVIASGEHHYGFSNWKSDISKFNAFNCCSHRDLVGERKRARPDLANWEKDKSHPWVGLQTEFTYKKRQLERWHNKQKLGFVGYS